MRIDFIVATALVAASLAIIALTGWWVSNAPYQKVDANFWWVGQLSSLLCGVMITTAIYLVLTGVAK